MVEEKNNLPDRFTEEDRLSFWEEMEKRTDAIKTQAGDLHLIFRSGKGRFAIAAKDCWGVLPWTDPSPLPFLPRYIMGSAFLRGRIVSVSDIHALLGIEPDRKPSYLIIVHEGELETTIGADVVEEVMPVDPDSMADPLNAWPGARVGLVKGVVKDSSPAIYVLDASRCLRQAT